MRKVILHCHLFKNAGTSLDALLKESFPDQWVTREFSGQPSSNRSELAQWIEDEPTAIAFSSHTMSLPPPEVEGIESFLLLFVRHPLDRIASAYAFERRQVGSGFGQVLARNTSLAGYIDVRLSLPNDRQCRDFHAHRLAQMSPAIEGNERERALLALASLPVVGLVEEFDRSMDRFAGWLQPHFPAFKPKPMARNVTPEREESIQDRIRAFRAEVGEECFARVIAANAADMLIYEAVRDSYSSEKNKSALDAPGPEG